jgi:hypothetical protein
VAGKHHGWDGEQDRLNPLRFVLLLIGIGATIGLIWWANKAGYIKHVESVPPPVTAPTDQAATPGPAALPPR